MRVLLALMAVLAFTASAGATNQVWFEASVVSGGGTVEVQGAPGVSVEATANGPTTFNVDIFLSTGTANLTAYWMQFEEMGDCPGLMSDHFLNEFNPGMSINYQEFTPAVWRAHYGGVVAEPAGTVLHVGSFLLDKNPLIDDYNYVWGATPPYYGVYTGAGSWGNGGQEIQWGGATPVGPYGVPFYYVDGAMMSVHCIPEPATIALLGLGVVALIRRR